MHDITIFCNQLMAKIPAGKKAIGNKGHRGSDTTPKSINCEPQLALARRGQSPSPPSGSHQEQEAQARRTQSLAPQDGNLAASLVRIMGILFLLQQQSLVWECAVI
jgi:hypothetical protein